MRTAPHPMTLRQLQYAVAVAETKSFRRAAERCRVAQPSLSAQIAQLEDALGVRLFERDRRRVLVTSAGAELVARAQKLLLDADDLVDTAHAARDPFRGTMRLGVIPTVGPYLLPEVAPRLRGQYPKLQIVWIEDKTAVLVARIAEGGLDGAIVAAESELAGLAVEPLGTDPFVLAAPKGHPLARARGPARTQDLEGETVLLLDDGHCFRDQALALCRRVGADESSVRATSLSTLTQMVAGGAGVTLLPSLAVGAENRNRALVVRSLGPKPPCRTLCLAFRRNAPNARALRAIADTLRDAYGRFVS